MSPAALGIIFFKKSLYFCIFFFSAEKFGELLGEAFYSSKLTRKLLPLTLDWHWYFSRDKSWEWGEGGWQRLFSLVSSKFGNSPLGSFMMNLEPVQAKLPSIMLRTKSLTLLSRVWKGICLYKDKTVFHALTPIWNMMPRKGKDTNVHISEKVLIGSDF